ncbi:P-loop NTPase fold protein [Cronobacter sakazakii]|uniref:P-loop NTPase fold protein n=1 Tax=Cronobacter sakazakii TaxID=28141 RepID=UPI000BE7D748|nr:P-loop NTPase fold protein [Cronobacter sakazakii]PUV43050.1 hypothetical protein CDU02_12725 [Cronobacter sakazakii]TWR40451.1 hypothetical protein FQY86_06175 [Cronobacter sakazakii]
MEYSNGNLIINVIHLLRRKRDGLILFDGKWGSGKTFFIKNKLPYYYDENNFFYISLLGLKDLVDFKARIIDCYYLKNIDELKTSLESLSGIGSVSSGSPASANVINNIFNSIGASVKEHILSDLKGVFILDDIERISNTSLANEILTYCHTKYMNAKGNALDFIIISNTSSECNYKLEHKEKIISDTIHYTPSTEDILDIDVIKERLIHFPEEDICIFKEITIHNKIVNIRILLRILDKITPLYLHIESNPHLCWKIPSVSVLKSMCSFFILLFMQNHSLEELIVEKDPITLAINDNADANQKKLWSSLNNYNINPELKKYYCGQNSLSDVLDIVFFTPKPLTMIDVATSVRPELLEIDERELYNTIVSIILRKIPCDLYCWLRTVQNYEYLTKHKYMPKSSLITLPRMTSILLNFNDNEIHDSFEKYELRSSNSFNSGLDDTRLLFLALSIRYKTTTKNQELLLIKNNIEFNGWASFDVESLTRIDPFGNYKPIQILGAPFLTKCIIKKWKVRDIEQFTAFLRSNYRISNISDFAINEKNSLIYLSHKLDIFIISRREGFRFGAILELNKIVKHAISTL